MLRIRVQRLAAASLSYLCLCSTLILSACGGSGGASKPSFSVSNISLAGPEDSAIAVSLNFPTKNAGLVVMVVTQSPGHGVLQGSYPSLTYQPRQDFNGSDSFRAVLQGNGAQSGEFTVLISVTPVNDAPQISGVPLTSALARERYRFTPVVSDVDSSQLALRVSNQPRWLSLVEAGRTLEGTPTNADAGTYENIGISVSDGVAETVLPTFSISVRTHPLRQLADIPSSKRIQTACAVEGNSLYSFGGVGIDHNDYDLSVLRLDLATNQWSEVSRMPEPIMGASTVRIGQRILLLGGFVSNGGTLSDTTVSRSVWIFDTVSASWSRGARLRSAKTDFGATALGDDVFVVGGRIETKDPTGENLYGAALQSVEIYNRATDSWSDGPALPAAVANGRAVSASAQVISISGLFGADCCNPGWFLSLRPTPGIWSVQRSNPELVLEDVREFKAVALRDQVYVFSSSGAENSLASIYQYDAITGRGLVLPPRNLGSIARYCVAADDSRIYILGGRPPRTLGPIGPADERVYEYDPDFD